MTLHIGFIIYIDFILLYFVHPLRCYYLNFFLFLNILFLFKLYLILIKKIEEKLEEKKKIGRINKNK